MTGGEGQTIERRRLKKYWESLRSVGETVVWVVLEGEEEGGPQKTEEEGGRIKVPYDIISWGDGRGKT